MFMHTRHLADDPQCSFTHAHPHLPLSTEWSTHPAPRPSSRSGKPCFHQAPRHSQHEKSKPRSPQSSTNNSWQANWEFRLAALQTHPSPRALLDRKVQDENGEEKVSMSERKHYYVHETTVKDRSANSFQRQFMKR